MWLLSKKREGVITEGKNVNGFYGDSFSDGVALEENWTASSKGKASEPPSKNVVSPVSSDLSAYLMRQLYDTDRGPISAVSTAKG